MKEYWQQSFDILVAHGLPKALLYNMCISSDDAIIIAEIVHQMQPRRVLEVGSFVGLSTGVITLASNKSSLIVCVDPDLSVSVQLSDQLLRANYPEHELLYRDEHTSFFYLERLLTIIGILQKPIMVKGFFSCLPQHLFGEQLLSLGADKKNYEIVGESVAQYAPYNIIFIDGDHYADAVYSDITLAQNYLADQGIMIFHDVEGVWGEQVCQGIRRFLAGHNYFSFEIRGNIGVLVRSH